MKKNLVLAALSLLVFAFAASAQTADFSGTWKLDVSKSKLGDRNMIAEQTLTVVQTAKDISVTPATKRTPPPDGMGGGGQGRGGMGGGDAKSTYTLDGKGTDVTVDSPMGPSKATLTGKLEAGKLMLSNARTFNGPNGEMTMTTKETWELSADGKTLTIVTERNTPRGTDTTTRVFAKS
ncbi:MAG: hypothetical protein KA746_01970 [Pyrinomonadaceae bacterium]|nr:hypothetical protein [Pyrinomonadaceae bacterium]MBP6211484.1 hypothetical protein [Pyrinomonadaceae bacterium]